MHRLRHFMQKQSPSCAPFSLALGFHESQHTNFTSNFAM
ncbi:hypothetical protein PULV_b0202 [Pseudoalteromonas ulvae UL12]|nr:hypothetical protein [Pseudoalteromonas ulvae UL12]